MWHVATQQQDATHSMASRRDCVQAKLLLQLSRKSENALMRLLMGKIL